MPSTIPIAPPISAVITLSCRIMRRTWLRVMPIARSIPSSRVRSKTVRTSVFTIPNRLTMTESASRTKRMLRIAFRPAIWLSMNSCFVCTFAFGNGCELLLERRPVGVGLAALHAARTRRGSAGCRSCGPRSSPRS